jgi:uncharacterized protein YbjT (DUF2867 family)
MDMKIVIIGGTGLIGRPLVGLLRAEGHEVVVASPSTGIDALTGAGLAQALTDAAVMVDVSNAPSFEDAAALAFFHDNQRAGSSARRGIAPRRRAFGGGDRSSSGIGLFSR